ncbi:MAG TPA: D-alanyl-D-alanine carboxypeptidase/D-alanyl-D-alanine-endopeptidase [Burkholderiaceae bacterium]
MIKSLSLIAAALLVSGCASFAPEPALPAPVRAALEKNGLPESTLAFVAFPLDERQAGLRFQADKPMQPASTMKLVTSVVGLDQLGRNSRGKAELLADTALQGEKGDVLPGALYLRGQGDSDLDWGALWLMLRSVREQGVREIRGGIVVDRSFFQPGRLDIGVPPFDEAPEFQYNVIPDALYLNGQLHGFMLQSDGEKVSARLFPAWPGMRVDASAMTLNDKPCKDWEAEWQIPAVSQDANEAVVRLQGAFPKNCKQEPSLNLIDRQWLATQAVRQMWRELGGTVSGEDRDGVTPANAVVLARHQSRPLAELMRGMLKSSDNPLTRIVYLRIGQSAAAPGEDTRVAAERTVRAWFAAHGIKDEGLVLDNGSGLSRSERITPAQMAGLLVGSHDGRHGPELLATLPVAGVDGTMSRRLKGTPAEGSARLKTGTLSSAVALAGFVPDAHGRIWVMAAMVNGEKISAKGRPVLDALVEWLATR